MLCNGSILTSGCNSPVSADVKEGRSEDLRYALEQGVRKWHSKEREIAERGSGEQTSFFHPSQIPIQFFPQVMGGLVDNAFSPSAVWDIFVPCQTV